MSCAENTECVDAEVVESSLLQGLKDVDAKIRTFVRVLEGEYDIPFHIFLAAIILLLTVIYVNCAKLFKRKAKGGGTTGAKSVSRGNGTVLICGPSNSGKTALFFRVLNAGSGDAEMAETQLSLMPNIDCAKAKFDEFDFDYRLVDFPGLTAFTAQVLSKTAAVDVSRDLRGVVVVVDSSDYESVIKASGHLFVLLESAAVVSRRVPVLVASNKADTGSSKASLASIKSTVLRQVNGFKDSRSTLASVGADDALAADGEDDAGLNTVALGETGVPLTWADLPSKVEFAEISVKTGDINPVLAFLSKLSQ